MSIASAVTPIGKKFRDLADRMTAEIQEKRRPMSQNATHKRLREYHSRLFDADQLESAQKGLYALAEANDNGTLPLALAGIKSKTEVLKLMRLESDRTGDQLRTTGKYSDTTPIGIALQQLVDAVLGSAGSEDAEALKVRRQIEDIENSLRFQKIPGFFPTPPALAKRVAELACINPGNLVLEPSAGLGHLADAVKEWQPFCTVHCIEIMPKLAEVLRLKNHAWLGSDFMADDWYIAKPTHVTPAAAMGKYDRIVMNPPFENGQDALHVQRAYSFLKPGGILVAIIGNGVLFRQDRKAVTFRDFINQHGYQSYPVPAGAFTGAEAFKQTGVATTIIVMRRQS
jgi:protein-L-isoaspartate O-methyltransferase